jgi:nitrous oxide reductase accessory protein NosL
VAAKRNVTFTLVLLMFMAIITAFPAGEALAGKAAVSAPADAKCPVCGMFVAKYPDWFTSLTFKDGSKVYFDGPKDMFTFCLNMKKYSPAKSPKDIAAIAVKDYSSLKVIDGRTAFFVSGSNVYGPMGKEIVPFAREADAREFLKDHNGNKILRFGEVTPAVLKSLE